MPKFLLKVLLNCLAKLSRVRFRRIKEHVAAGEHGLHVRESQCGERGSQLSHLYGPVPPYVYAAKKRSVGQYIVSVLFHARLILLIGVGRLCANLHQEAYRPV